MTSARGAGVGAIPDMVAFCLMGLVLVAGMGLAAILYAGPYYSYDDGSYIFYAHQIMSGNFSIAQSPYAYGYLMPASLALSFLLLGASPFSAVVPQLLEYALILAMAFLIGRRLYGNGAGLVGALLAATAPFVVSYTTRVLPDMLLGALAGVSIYLLVIARGTARPKLLLVGAGAAAGLTVYVKLLGLAFMLFFFIAALMEGLEGEKTVAAPGRKERGISMGLADFGYVAAGMLALMAAYLATVYLATGNPLYTFINYGNFQGEISPSSLGNNIATLTAMTVGYFATTNGNILGQAIHPLIYPLGMMLFWAFLGSLMGGRSGDRNADFLSIVLWGSFLYYFYGTISLTSYTLMDVVSRYFLVLAVPMAVLGGYAIMEFYGIFRRTMGHAVACIMVAAVLIEAVALNLPAYSTVYSYDLAVSGSAALLGEVAAMAASWAWGANTVFYTNDMAAGRYLEFLSGYGTLHVMDGGTSCVPAANGMAYLLFYDNSTRAQDIGMLRSWAGGGCSLVPVGNFSDINRITTIGAFNNTDLYASVYRVAGRGGA